MEGQEDTQQLHLVLANKLFLLTHPDVEDIEKVRLRDDVLTAVVADVMAPLYETLAANAVLSLDQKVLDSMCTKIDEELKKIDDKSKDRGTVQQRAERLFLTKVPRQPGTNECGYYVMRFIRDIMEDINVLQNNFNGKQVYLQSEIDEVRDEWASGITSLIEDGTI